MQFLDGLLVCIKFSEQKIRIAIKFTTHFIHYLSLDHSKLPFIFLKYSLHLNFLGRGWCICGTVPGCMCTVQGARNRRERQLTRFALPYDYTCFADGTPFYIELFDFLVGPHMKNMYWLNFFSPVSPIHIFPVGPYWRNQTARYKILYRAVWFAKHV